MGNEGELQQQLEGKAASQERTGQGRDLQDGCEESGRYSIDGTARKEEKPRHRRAGLGATTAQDRRVLTGRARVAPAGVSVNVRLDSEILLLMIVFCSRGRVLASSVGMVRGFTEEKEQKNYDYAVSISKYNMSVHS